VLKCEVSLYPMDTADSDSIINNAIESLKKQGVNCDVGSVSTYFTGTHDEVWSGLKILYETAEREGKEVSMVATITNSKK